MGNNYFLLAVSIFGMFIMIFKLKGNYAFRLLGVVLTSNSILISIARILSITHVMQYHIGFLGAVSYIIMTIMAWSVRKVPGKKFVAYYWLIGTPLIIVFVIIALTFLK